MQYYVMWMFPLPFQLNVQTIIFTSTALNSMGGMVARPPYPALSFILPILLHSL